MFERNPFMQVVPAPKKKTKKENDDKDKSTEVKPQTWCQKATSMMADLLKWAADARTASLKLADTQYASELSGQLLQHAQHLEELYSKASKALSEGAEEKKFKGLVEKANALEAFGTKAQAGIGLGKTFRTKPWKVQWKNLLLLSTSEPFPLTSCQYDCSLIAWDGSQSSFQAAAEAFLKPKKSSKAKSKKGDKRNKDSSWVAFLKCESERMGSHKGFDSK